ncbi:TorF family putative porin [Massilia niabensis]|uniref:TorF family putative porin n=1 Tax=Massilia niabensis TaxID=544910 RepID=A0ABW0L1K4_9BURK
MKTTILPRLLSLACLVLLGSSRAYADDATGQPAARGLAWSSNASTVSQYVSRGFRQTWGKPALQGGFDVAHPSGWSAGTWMSSVSDRYIENGKLEWDLYGGYTGAAGPVGYSLMALVYRYPGAVMEASGTKFDYAELSGGITYKSLYARYNHTVTRDFFGITGARGTGYVDAGANLAIGDGYVLNLHAGEGRVAGPGNDYWDWRDIKLGMTRALPGGWSVAGAWTRAFGATDAYDRYTTGVPNAAGHTAYSNPAEGTFVLTLTRTF